MSKKSLDKKYSYQIDEHNVVHLFRGEDDCQQYLTNPLLSAIFKIETLKTENAELKEALKNDKVCKCSHYLNFKDLEKENAELKEENRQLKNEVEDLRGYCNQIGKVKTEVLKAFEHIVAR